jgi:hypothetical protein
VPEAADRHEDPGTPRTPEIRLERGRHAAGERPLHGRFAGVLEGRVGDAPGLRAAAKRIAKLGVVECDLEIDGGRFSLMFDEDERHGDRLDPERLDALVLELDALLEHTDDTAPAESTLRGTIVRPSTVDEVLFSVRGRRIELLRRSRPTEARDHAEPASGLPRTSVARGVAILALIVVLGGLLAWQRGYVAQVRDALFAPTSDSLALDPGPFDDLLLVSVDQKFNKYTVTIRRGPGYPVDGAPAEQTRTPEQRAAGAAVVDGRSISVILSDEANTELAGEVVGLAPLLGAADAEVTIEIPARFGARTILLSLERPKIDSTGR